MAKLQKNTLVDTEQIRPASRPDLTPVKVPLSSQTNSNKKLKGKVVDKNGIIKFRNNQVIIYAIQKTETNNLQAVVIGVCITDSEGNFFLPVPTGQFESATAIVSINPDEVKEIVLNEKKEFPDFVWLILETLPVTMTQDEHDDCACNGNKTPSLPDMEDLLENSAYSQDIGGSCINFTTPNRALEEFTYQMVVRTSDPELLGLSKEKINERIKNIDDQIASINLQLKPFTTVLHTAIDFNILPKEVSEGPKFSLSGPISAILIKDEPTVVEKAVQKRDVNKTK